MYMNLFSRLLLYLMASFSSSSSSSSLLLYSSICKPFHIRGNTLLVASRIDPAGVNMFTCLVSKAGIFTPSTEHKDVWFSTKKAYVDNNEEQDITYLWLQDQRLLELDEVDDIFCKEFNINTKFDDIIFLSMHKAASGKASLTVHPIGIPWLSDNSVVGGTPGRCSPPSQRIASLYRTLYKETKRRQLDSKYQVTLEATHHGPHVSKPVCFFEIGSTEEHWSIPECGDIMADVLISHLGLYNDDNDSGKDDTTIRNENVEIVMCCIGGGHYVPKQCDGARLENMYTGHAITTYAFDGYFEGTIEKPVEGGWSSIVNESITATRLSFPNAEIIYFVDKKAFIAANRNAICSLLESNDIKWSFSFSDIKSMYEKKMLQAV